MYKYAESYNADKMIAMVLACLYMLLEYTWPVAVNVFPIDSPSIDSSI